MLTTAKAILSNCQGIRSLLLPKRKPCLQAAWIPPFSRKLLSQIRWVRMFPMSGKRPLPLLIRASPPIRKVPVRNRPKRPPRLLLRSRHPIPIPNSSILWIWEPGYSILPTVPMLPRSRWISGPSAPPSGIRSSMPATNPVPIAIHNYIIHRKCTVFTLHHKVK